MKVGLKMQVINGKVVKSVNKPVIKTFVSVTDYHNEVNDSLKRSADVLNEQMSPANIDLTILATPNLATKSTVIGGRKFRIDIHCDNNATRALTNHSKRDIGALLQIWGKNGSMIVTIPNDKLNDARVNWEARQ
jgi:hypothetical protein